MKVAMVHGSELQMTSWKNLKINIREVLQRTRGLPKIFLSRLPRYDWDGFFNLIDTCVHTSHLFWRTFTRNSNFQKLVLVFPNNFFTCTSHENKINFYYPCISLIDQASHSSMVLRSYSSDLEFYPNNLWCKLYV